MQTTINYLSAGIMPLITEYHGEAAAVLTRQQSGASHWRGRMASALNRLECESRRMFQLEEDLGRFAGLYYDAVGDAAARLTQIESRLTTDGWSTAPDATIAAMPEIMAGRDARHSRHSEIKARYRALAKEIHPDRAILVEGGDGTASTMQALNTAYRHGDLAAMLKIEAQMLLVRIAEAPDNTQTSMEQALRDTERAAETYAQGYRDLLHSPLNDLMLRAMAARLAGWDWIQAVVRKVERSIEEKERAAALASIAAIGAWRDNLHDLAA